MFSSIYQFAISLPTERPNPSENISSTLPLYLTSIPPALKPHSRTSGTSRTSPEARQYYHYQTSHNSTNTNYPFMRTSSHFLTHYSSIIPSKASPNPPSSYLTPFPSSCILPSTLTHLIPNLSNSFTSTFGAVPVLASRPPTSCPSR